MASEQSQLDKAVEVALAAYVSSRGSYEGEVPASSDDIRAAILAALPVLLGEPVAWRVGLVDEPELGTWLAKGRGRDGDGITYEPLYAPSLGEGE